MIKVGLIGCGFMGGMHAACYKALQALGVQVTAVADVRASYAQEVAAKSDAKIYETGMELIEKADVDVVDICLPTQLHVSHAVAAMRAQKINSGIPAALLGFFLSRRVFGRDFVKEFIHQRVIDVRRSLFKRALFFGKTLNFL